MDAMIEAMLEGDVDGTSVDAETTLNYPGWTISYTATNLGIDPELYDELTENPDVKAHMLHVRCYGMLMVKWVKLPLLYVVAPARV